MGTLFLLTDAQVPDEKFLVLINDLLASGEIPDSLLAVEYQNSIENYAYLWVDDRKEFLRQFLLYGHVLTAEEIEAAEEEGVTKTPPTLDQFEEQVDSYEKSGAVSCKGKIVV